MKTPPYRIADQAEADMEDIWLYIAEHNLDAAETLMGKFRLRFGSLARTPGLGRRRTDLRSDLRSVAVGSYVIFYRELIPSIEIVRVLHGAMNLPDQFR